MRLESVNVMKATRRYVLHLSAVRHLYFIHSISSSSCLFFVCIVKPQKILPIVGTNGSVNMRKNEEKWHISVKRALAIEI